MPARSSADTNIILSGGTLGVASGYLLGTATAIAGVSGGVVSNGVAVAVLASGIAAG